MIQISSQGLQIDHLYYVYYVYHTWQDKATFDPIYYSSLQYMYYDVVVVSLNFLVTQSQTQLPK